MRLIRFSWVQMLREYSFILLLPILLGCSQASSAQNRDIILSWQFDSGSLGGWSINEQGEVILVHSKDSGGLWYHFQVEGVKDKTFTFIFESVRSDYFGGLCLPAFSYDRVNWTFIKDRLIEPHDDDPTQVRFSFTHTFSQDRAWIAYTPPFSNTMLDEWLAAVEDHPALKIETVCETPIHNLPLPLLNITDHETGYENKQVIFILCREDAYETAGTWFAKGLAQFLLSEDPVALELLQRAVFLIVPIFDRDGVAQGSAIHPLPATGEGVFWTETWPESTISFHEQRQLKLFLQRWKDKNLPIHGSLRIHSNEWQANLFRPEYASEANREAQKNFLALLTQRFVPWTEAHEPAQFETRFSRVVYEMFPSAITGYFQSDFVYPGAFPTPFDLYKLPEDMMLEGEFFARSIASALEIPERDSPPFLLGADLYALTGNVHRQIHVRCVYRDLENRPPEYVRFVANEQIYDLTPVDVQNQEYRSGVLYAGFITLEQAENTYSFTTSNGSNVFSTPSTPAPGPFLKRRAPKKSP